MVCKHTYGVGLVNTLAEKTLEELTEARRKREKPTEADILEAKKRKVLYNQRAIEHQERQQEGRQERHIERLKRQPKRKGRR